MKWRWRQNTRQYQANQSKETNKDSRSSRFNPNNLVPRNVNKRRQTIDVSFTQRPASEVRNFECPCCSYVADCRTSLRIHRKSHVNNGLKCDHCNRFFASLQSLKQHSSTHICPESPFICFGCFRRFPTADKKLAHHKVCLNRQYQCYLCENVFYFQKERLISHMVNHTGRKPFKCQICMKLFKSQNYLRRHLNNHHSNK